MKTPPLESKGKLMKGKVEHFYTLIDHSGRYWNEAVGASVLPVLFISHASANTEKNKIHNRYYKTVRIIKVSIQESA